jgi:hypothetical protein
MGQANIAHDAGPRARGSRTSKANASSSSGENCLAVRCVTTKRMLTLMPQQMCITRFIANGTGLHAESRQTRRHLPLLWKMVPEVPARPLRLQAVGEKPGEGNPADPGQARMQVSIHVKVVGLALVQRGYVPAYLPSRKSPDPIASWKMAGTPGRPKGEGRRERYVWVCSELAASLTIEVTYVYLWKRFTPCDGKPDKVAGVLVDRDGAGSKAYETYKLLVCPLPVVFKIP